MSLMTRNNRKEYHAKRYIDHKKVISEDEQRQRLEHSKVLRQQRQKRHNDKRRQQRPTLSSCFQGSITDNQQQKIDTVIIIPMRDREDQFKTFRIVMNNSLQLNPNIQMLFVEQAADGRPFNKAAMLNIGAIYLRETMKGDFGDINIVTHDIDVLLVDNKNDFQALFATTAGVVKHIYGFEHALSGVVVIKGSDFWNINGLPMLWGWGYQDVAFRVRVEDHQLCIERNKNEFLRANAKSGVPGVVQLEQSAPGIIPTRNILISEWKRYEESEIQQIRPREGISDVKDLTYVYDTNKQILHVSHFSTSIVPDLNLANRGVVSFLSEVQNKIADN